ncbi:MAG: AAA family ATPase, partial [Acidimicrobiia bacterium]
VVLVEGSAGAGKSRLLAEVTDRCPLPVIAARAFLPEREEPWGLARSLLREALALDLEAAATLPERAAVALADVLPELEDLRALPSAAIDRESRRALALEAAVGLIGAVATKGALVVVDDLQWADATSLAVLGLVARRVPRAALALAYRPEEVTVDAPAGSFLDELRSVRGPVTEIALGPLRPEAISLLVADEAVASALADTTDRTPMAIAEAIRGLSAEGVLALDAGGRWEARCPEAAHRTREVARSGQRRAIAARAGRQPPDRRRLLSLLSLLSREAPARVFTRATGATEVTVLDDLDALARAGLARLGEAGWATAHDLISEVVAESLDRSERGRLHQLLGRAVQAEGGDPAEVARHLLGAGDRTAAVAAFSEAARQRLSAFAGDEARELAETGLVLDPPAAVRTALLRTRAEARALQG